MREQARRRRCPYCGAGGDGGAVVEDHCHHRACHRHGHGKSRLACAPCHARARLRSRCRPGGGGYVYYDLSARLETNPLSHLRASCGVGSAPATLVECVGRMASNRTAQI